MKKNRLKILTIVFLTMAAANVMGAAINTSTNQIPPPPDTPGEPCNAKWYHGPAVYNLHVVYGGNFYLDKLGHSCWDTSHVPPPNVGTIDIHSFNSTITCIWHDGLTSIPITANALCTVKMTKLSGTAVDAGTYSNEMLQLDISGGNLPPGVIIRESPTLQSTGLTTITNIGSGQYQIDSYFDNYTELSTDNGLTWIPQTSPAAHVELAWNPAYVVPTLNQWGLILFSLLLLALGMVLVYRRQGVLVLAGNVNQVVKSSMFDRSLYFKVLGIVLLFTVIGLAAINWYFDGLSSTDKVGTIISAVIVAFMVQLWMLMRRK